MYSFVLFRLHLRRLKIYVISEYILATFVCGKFNLVKLVNISRYLAHFNTIEEKKQEFKLNMHT